MSSLLALPHGRMTRSQYLSVLSAHIEAASGGSIGVTKLEPEHDEVRQVLSDAGVPFGAPLHVLHAYRLRNAKLQEDFNRRAAAGVPSSANGGGDAGAVPPAPQGYTQRILALRLPPTSVEHALVHGLRPKPPVAKALDWQVDPRTVPEAGCVDMKSLASIVGASTPLRPPFALFAGAAAWDELLANAIEEAITARDGLAAGLASSRGSDGGKKGAQSAVSGGSGAPANRLLLLCRVLVPTLPSDGVADQFKRAAAAGGGGLLAHHARLAPTHPPPGTASTTDPELILPLYLLHYGTMTAPPPEPQPVPAPLGVTSGSEKNVGASEKSAATEPRAVRNDSRGSKSSSSTRGSSAAAAAAAANGASARSAAPSAREPAADTGEFGKLTPALRATREHQVYLSCRAATTERMREVAHIFAATIEGITQQLTPARANSIVVELRREAELNVLLADAKAELTKLKKANRDLASELNVLISG